MVWFFLIPSIPAVLGNFVIPMMIGARDVAFPKLNLLSWYLFNAGGLLALYSIVFGGVDTGWTFYTPYSSAFSNSHVVSMAAGVFVAGFGSILTGLNFIITIHTMRAPGLTLASVTIVPLVALFNERHPCSGDAGPGDHARADGAGTHLGLGHFRSQTRGRPGSFSAPVLVLLPSRRLHHDSSRNGCHQ